MTLARRPVKRRRALADLVDDAVLRALATPSNLRLGREIVARGEVEFVDFGRFRVVARVGGGQWRTFELKSMPAGLRWKCTCTGRRERLCKHGVATGLAVRRRTRRKVAAKT